MTGRSAWRLSRAGAPVAFLLLLAACSTDTGSKSSGGEIFRGGSSHGSSGQVASSDATAGATVVLKTPAGTDPVTIQAAADIVRDRLNRMQVRLSTVIAEPDGVAVTSFADNYQLQAAARRISTTIASIASTALGPCNGPGYGTTGPAQRCYTLGPTATTLAAVGNAAPRTASGAGWKVTFTVDPGQYQPFRAAIDAAGQGPLALVADGVVLLAFQNGIPALQSSLGPGLTEEQARQVAAALAVNSDLPIALAAPPLPPAHGARVNLDFWTAALGVRICGTWLPNAPPIGLDTGVHSHGDGLIYVHPFKDNEAGDHATLGLFLERGKWKASHDSLELWDNTKHTSGDACPDRSPAKVRWWVDGVEQDGNPGDFVPHNGQAIVLSFDAGPAPPGAPPQLNSLYLPTLGAETNS